MTKGCYGLCCDTPTRNAPYYVIDLWHFKYLVPMLQNFQDFILCYFGIFSHYFYCDYNYHNMINSHFVKDVFRLNR
jgi:hypothetical protein